MLEQLKPERVFNYFEQICRIPHGSGNPQLIGDFCVSFARAHGLECRRDTLGNVVIYKDGDRARKPVILQGHLDMVCVADSGVEIDFAKDPIPVQTDGTFVFANGTSLGGDDGIAVAMILALLEDKTLSSPPIEAVFTMDEETGMFGAAGLDPALLQGRRMLNLDSEAEGTFWVSCAGGERVIIRRSVRRVQNTDAAVQVRLSGLQGGHSGTEIDKGRLNAVRCMAELLRRSGGQIAALHGGKVDNAIPTECCSVWVGDPNTLRQACEALLQQWRDVEPHAAITFEACPVPRECVCASDSQAAADLILALPWGVQAWSRELEGLVETSLNLGVCDLQGDELCLHYSVRSGVDASRLELIGKMEKIAEEAGASSERTSPYPAWQYRAQSPLRETATRVYENLFGAVPRIEAIHAGLECGLFAGKIPGLDCLSIGPDILDIHSPKERLSAPSTDRTYQFLRKILEQLD